jgi:hypothetical protein
VLLGPVDLQTVRWGHLNATAIASNTDCVNTSPAYCRRNAGPRYRGDMESCVSIPSRPSSPVRIWVNIHKPDRPPAKLDPIDEQLTTFQAETSVSVQLRPVSSLELVASNQPASKEARINNLLRNYTWDVIPLGSPAAFDQRTAARPYYIVQR